MDEKKKKSLSDELLSDDFFKPPSDDIFGTPERPPAPSKKEAPKRGGAPRKSLSEELGEDFLKPPMDIPSTGSMNQGLPPTLEEELPPPSTPAPSIRTFSARPLATGTGTALAIGLGIAALVAVLGGGGFYFFVLRTPSPPATVATAVPPPPPKQAVPEAQRVPVTSPPPQAAPEAPKLPVASPPQAAPQPAPVVPAPTASPRPALPPPVVTAKVEKPKFTLVLGEFKSEDDLSKARKKAEDTGLETKVSKSTTSSEVYYVVTDKFPSPEEANAVSLKLSILGIQTTASGPVLKAGPFSSLMDALGMKGKLGAAGYQSKPEISTKTVTIYRLTGGKFVTKNEASDVLSSLNKKGLSPRIVPLGK